MNRRRSIGAEVVDGGVHFRVWAPARRKVSVVIDERDHPLDRETAGYFSGRVPETRDGTLYRFRLDEDSSTFPDPASRFQPEGPHGPSEVIDPRAYAWQSRPPNISGTGIVISEIHIGTFTTEGTFAAAIEKLPLIEDAGINMLEVMPIHEFPGRFGWGYDGVDLWAPTRLYGRPDDFRRFVDAAHARGIAVILDVVYNHFGPDGCYLRQFTPQYFSTRYANEWGESPNFDDDGCEGVREFVSENAAYWIDEFHLDGLRLDATQSLHDASSEHILKTIERNTRAAACGRSIFVVAENEPQDARLIRDFGLDALWNDDWHHAAAVALTGRIEAYYADYRGSPQEFVSMAKHGFVFQGQWHTWQKQRRGTPSFDLEPRRLVQYMENHDQVANSTTGQRMRQLTSPGKLRALTALLLLSPQTPMLFQGQEFHSSKPFLYFADHNPDLAQAVRKGRGEFLSQFPSMVPIIDRLPPPEGVDTFEQCKLDWSEREKHQEALDFHRELIRLRRTDPTFSAQRKDNLDGAVLGDRAFVLRWFGSGDDDRLLVVNLGTAVALDVAPEPLLAPPRNRLWEILWSSGSGTEIEIADVWRIQPECAVVLRPK